MQKLKEFFAWSLESLVKAFLSWPQMAPITTLEKG